MTNKWCIIGRFINGRFTIIVMEKRILQPEQIIVPGEYELGNESIFKIYFRVFDRGHGGDLPPVIISKHNVLEDNIEKRMRSAVQAVLSWRDHAKSSGAVFADDTADEKIRKIMDIYPLFLTKTRESEYYLIDGNHKSAAATLTHQPIYALELQSNKDLAEVRRRVRKGELFDFKRPETSLRKLILSFEEYILGDHYGNDMHIEDFNTVRERINRLTSNGDLPRYMKDRYLRGK